jgi:mannose-6-phosphate isomerase-like protein (cupin superfamily)
MTTPPYWRTRFARVLLFFIFLSSTLSGCSSWSQRGADGLGTLPKAEPEERNFSSYQPAHPYVQITRGLLGRKLYATSAEAGARIEVHDFLVGPGQRTDSYALQAPSVFEVRSGSGSLRLGDKLLHIEAGTVVPVPLAQPFIIENQSDTPIAISVEVLGGK